jgi:CRP-like cAMP-binding protein
MTKTNHHRSCQGRSNCNACALRREMVCGDVSLDDLIDFHAGIDDFDFAPGTTLFAMETPADAVYCIRGGAVKMVHYEPSGVVRIVRVLKTGDVAGLEATFRERHEYSAIAVGTVRACRIPMPYFHKFIESHGSLQMRLMETSQAALSEAQNTGEDMAAILGITFETVSRLVSEFKRLGILQYIYGSKGTKYFRGDIAALEKIAQEG